MIACPLALIPRRIVALRPLRDPLSSPSSPSLASPSPRAPMLSGCAVAAAHAQIRRILEPIADAAQEGEDPIKENLLKECAGPCPP